MLKLSNRKVEGPPLALVLDELVKAQSHFALATFEALNLKNQRFGTWLVDFATPTLQAR